MCSNIKLELLAKFNRQHVFTTFDARIYVECKNKEGLKSSKYISLFEPRQALLQNIFIFTFYISYTCVECGKDVMSYFAVQEQVRGTGIKMKDEYKAEIWR